MLNEKFYFQRLTGFPVNTVNQHYHSTFEIYYLKSGKCSYFIDNRSYEVEPGDLILIPEGTIHRTNYSVSKRERLLINCTEDFIPESARKSLTSVIPFYRNPSTSTRVEELFSKIEEEYERADDLTLDALRCLVGELLFLILRASPTKAALKTGSALIENAAKYIQENYAGEIRLSSVAEMLAISPEHLSRSFKRETGFGFNEYLTLIRLQKAEYMLIHEPGLSISEVAYACGFNDSNYFSDKFKRTYGIPPSKINSR